MRRRNARPFVQGQALGDVFTADKPAYLAIVDDWNLVDLAFSKQRQYSLHFVLRRDLD